MKCVVTGRAGVCLGVVLGLLWGLGKGEESKFRADEDEGYGSSYENLARNEHLKSNSLTKAFRPRTAKEAIRLAGRIAEQEAKKEPKQSFSFLYDSAKGGRPVRIDVQNVVEATTSRWNYKDFRRPNKLPQKNEWPDSSGLDDSIPFERPVRKKFDHGQTARKVRSQKSGYINFKKKKKSRSKREVGDSDTSFNLPPMSNDWQIKRKKKKKKKKKNTEAPATKKMQTKSKKLRPYLESGELDLGKAKVGKKADIVRDLSKELDNLLNAEEEFELATSAPLEPAVQTRVAGAKFVEVPKNWQKPPSWKPPTLRPKVQGIPVGKRRQGIATIGPRVYSDEVLPAPTVQADNQYEDVEDTTLFDWRNYENPLNPSTHKIVFRPGPEDWPEPTHPSDGIYDWHKAQIRLGHTSPKPYFASYDNTVPHPTWARSRFVQDESDVYHRNDMWQTRPWIPQVRSLSTWPPIATRAVFSKTGFEKKEQKGDEFLDEKPQILGRKGNQRKTGLMEEVHLTAGPPLATVDEPYAVGFSQKEQKGDEFLDEKPQILGRKGNQRKTGLMEEVHLTAGPPLATVDEPYAVGFSQDRKSGSVSANNHQESHQYSYNYGPHHSSWQSNLQGQQKSSHGMEQYQSYQNYHANHTSNSYSQYYQHYESRLGNRSAEVQYEQGHHYEDPIQASGHYQAHYQYQERPKAYQPHQQVLPHQQHKIMPPSYFYSVHDKLTTAHPDRSTVRIPFRAPDEYAGNDRDLRGPMPQKIVFEYPEGQGSLYPTRGWLGYRFNRMGPPRRGITGRFRRPMFRSIFKAPLQKDTWTTSKSPNQ